MNWTELLKTEIEDAYAATEGLIDKVDDLDWKPATGDNWMTTGQLLQHITTACGMCIRGFVTGEWGIPEGAPPPEDAKPEDMMPPASAMPSAESVEAVKAALAEDKQVGLAMIAEAGEERIATEPTVAPWDQNEVILGRRLLGMIDHLRQHKAQLFFYLKAQGKPVNTWDLYGV